MSPRIRRALHEALDLVLDAVAEEALETPEPKKKKTPVPKIVPDPQVDEISRKRAQAALKGKGFRLSGTCL